MAVDEDQEGLSLAGSSLSLFSLVPPSFRVPVGSQWEAPDGSDSTFVKC